MRSLSWSVWPAKARATTSLKNFGYLLLEWNKGEASSNSSCCCTASFSTSLQISVSCSGFYVIPPERRWPTSRYTQENVVSASFRNAKDNFNGWYCALEQP